MTVAGTPGTKVGEGDGVADTELVATGAAALGRPAVVVTYDEQLAVSFDMRCRTSETA